MVTGRLAESFLRQLERGVSSASVATLQRPCRVLGLPSATLDSLSYQSSQPHRVVEVDGATTKVFSTPDDPHGTCRQRAQRQGRSPHVLAAIDRWFDGRWHRNR